MQGGRINLNINVTISVNVNISPQGLIFGGAIKRKGFLRYEFGGGGGGGTYIWRGLYMMKWFILGILWYLWKLTLSLLSQVLLGCFVVLVNIWTKTMALPFK